MTNDEIMKALLDCIEPKDTAQDIKHDLVSEIQNINCPKVIKELLKCDLTFHEAIDKLIEKEKEAENKEQIEKLTAAILKICK